MSGGAIFAWMMSQQRGPDGDAYHGPYTSSMAVCMSVAMPEPEPPVVTDEQTMWDGPATNGGIRESGPA